MAKKDKVIFKKRAFLNDDVSMSGFIIAIVEEFTYNNDGDRVSAYPTLDLGDCSNKISLDFSFYNPKQMKKAQKKVELVRAAINGFADAFASEVKRFEEAEKSRPKTRKKSRKEKTTQELFKEILED